MTKLDKQFFNTFEIKPKYTYLVTDMFYTSNSHNYEVTKNDLIEYFGSKNCGRYKVTKVYKTYPQITDRILLELICIMADFTTKEDYCYAIFANNIERLRVHILEDCIEYKENIELQVQTLFKEE